MLNYIGISLTLVFPITDLKTFLLLIEIHKKVNEFLILISFDGIMI